MQFEPGRKMTDSERAALAADNERMSKEAIERARAQAEYDRLHGKAPGIAGAIQDTSEQIKAKLQGEEYHPRSELRER